MLRGRGLTCDNNHLGSIIKTEKIQRGDKEGTGDLPMRFNCASKINCHQESCEGPLFVMRTSEGNCLCTDLQEAVLTSKEVRS